MLHTGRMLIDLKPRPRRPGRRSWRGCSERVQQVAGVTLYLQPTQDLTIDAETGPTEYRVSLEGADTATVTTWVEQAGRRDAQRATSCATPPAMPARRAWRPSSTSTATPRRASASPRAPIDDALYSAFGQRIVSTIFTETNQYRVILEAQPGLLDTAESLGKLNLRTSSGEPTPLDAIATHQRAARAAADHARRPVPGVDDRLRHRARRLARRGGRRDPRRRQGDRACRRRVQLTFLGASGAYERSLSNQLWLILAAVICVYIVLGVLYESYIHPLTILSTLPSAGVGALLALLITRQRPRRDRHHRHHPADRHRQEERDHDDRLRDRGRAQRGQAAARGDPPGGAAALPADPDDDAGGAVRRAAADARLGRGRTSCAGRSAWRSSAA